MKKLIAVVPSVWLNALTLVCLLIASSATTRSSRWTDELRQQIAEVALVADQANLLGHAQRGLEQAVGNGLGHGIGNADPEVEAAPGLALAAHRRLQFGTERKDLVGVAQRGAPFGREFHAAPALLEQAGSPAPPRAA